MNDLERVARAERELDEALKDIGGCSDGYCIVVKPKGMHTNGGCHCNRDGHKMIRVVQHYKLFHAAISHIIKQGGLPNETR